MKTQNLSIPAQQAVDAYINLTYVQALLEEPRKDIFTVMLVLDAIIDELIGKHHQVSLLDDEKMDVLITMYFNDAKERAAKRKETE